MNIYIYIYISICQKRRPVPNVNGQTSVGTTEIEWSTPPTPEDISEANKVLRQYKMFEKSF